MPFDLITSSERLGDVANALVGQPAVGLDIETTSLRPWDGEIRLISVKTPTHHYVVDLFKTGPPDVLVRALEAEKSVIKVIQNAKFETRWFLHHYGLDLWPIFDPFRASSLIYNGHFFPQDLHAIQLRELSVQPGADLAASNWAGELSAEQLQYSADDTEHLLDLRAALKEKLTKYGLNKVAGIEFGAVLPEAAIENRGFYLDAERWHALYEINKAKEKALRIELLAELPHPTGQLSLPGLDDGNDFNLGSTQQLQKSLAQLGIKLDSTRKDAISMLLPKTRKASLRALLNKLIEYKKVRKLCESFGLDYLKNIDPKTGRIHASYYPFTGAGRYACSEPNLQQLPRQAEFRACFRAEGENGLGVWDYSQIELRIAAEIAQDARMIRAYREGLDLHSLTAALLNDMDPKEVTKAMRTAAKAGNFGLCYGMGANKFIIYAQSQYGLTYDEAEAQEFIAKFFAGYQGLQRWHRKVFSDGNRNKGYTRTLSGRLRYLKPTAYSEFANTPVQGTGADGLKVAMRLCYDRLKPYRGQVDMVNIVHDEIVSEMKGRDPEFQEQVDSIMKQCMVEGMQQFLPHVPVVVEGGWGETWADK